MTIRRTKTLFGIALALFTAAAVGCAANEDEPSVADAEQPLDEASSADGTPDVDAERRHHKKGRRGHHAKKGGPHQVFWAALKKLDLSDAQRDTIEGLAKGLRERPELPAAHLEQRKALAEAVVSGKVDPAAFDAPDHAPMEAKHAKMVAAIDELHATLTPEQRSELVGILKTKAEKRAERWANKRERMQQEGTERRREGRRGKRGKSPLGLMLRGLDVSEDQRDQIESALAEAGLDQRPDETAWKARKEDMKKRQAAMLEAFANESFDAATQIPAPPAKMADHHERFVESLAVVVPFLDDSQRTELAQRIERGPRHFDKRRGSERRRGMKGRRHGRGGPETN